MSYKTSFEKEKPFTSSFKIKIEHSPENYSEPRRDECYFLSLKLSTLCYALMNSIVPSANQVLSLPEQLTQRTRDRGKLLQSPYFFSAPSPHAINPTASTHGHFVLSPVSLESRDQDGGPSNSTRSTSMILRKNRGL